MISPGAWIHNKAVVGPGVRIGAGTKIWQFASVIRGAQLGADCNVGSCAIVDGAMVGNGCAISHGVSLNPGIEIRDGVFVGPNVTFCNDRWPSTSKIGFDIDLLMGQNFVTTLIGAGASIGAGVIILPGVSVGAGAFVAAGAVVDRSIPDHYMFQRGGRIVAIDPARSRLRMIDYRAGARRAAAE